MRIYCWNVNGLRACAKKGFGDWLDKCEGDIVALQEVRATPEQLTAAIRGPDGWHTHFAPAEKLGYSGVGSYSRRKPDEIITSLGEERFDREGRLQIARYGNLLLVNCYFPNGSGKNRDHSRIPYKLDFYQALYDLLELERKRGTAVLVGGDFNTCHKEIDLARPKPNVKTSGFTPIEREELDRWIRSGWVDTFRIYDQSAEKYSWWSQRRGVCEKNIGWRLDMILASEAALPYVKAAAIHTDVLGSDHCPISVDVDPAIMG